MWFDYILKIKCVDQDVIMLQSKRIAKEKRIMNWEKLFAKLTVARGHGRRWKFLIHAFKKKADEG